MRKVSNKTSKEKKAANKSKPVSKYFTSSLGGCQYNDILFLHQMHREGKYNIWL
jgi:hypothetical protein